MRCSQFEPSQCVVAPSPAVKAGDRGIGVVEIEYQMNLLSSKLMRLGETLTLASSKAKAKAFSRHMHSSGMFNAEFESSMKQNEAVKILRYLCVLNGYEIFCLNLNEGKNESFTNAKDIPLLPKIGTLDLLEKGLPASVGLFSLGSEAY